MEGTHPESPSFTRLVKIPNTARMAAQTRSAFPGEVFLIASEALLLLSDTSLRTTPFTRFFTVNSQKMAAP
jgi:hypothetical protein